MENLIPQLLPFILGPVVAFLTEMAKKAPAVPFKGDTTTGLIVVLGALSSLLVIAVEIAVAYLAGNLAAYDWAKAVTTVINVAQTLFVAAGAFGLYKKATT